MGCTDRKTYRHTEGRHRPDPERENKECRDGQMGGSHKTDPHEQGPKGRALTLEARGTSWAQQL